MEHSAKTNKINAEGETLKGYPRFADGTPFPDPWDYVGPEAYPDFHPSRDFLDMFIDEVSRWQSNDQDRIEDVRRLLYRLETLEVPGPGNVDLGEMTKTWFHLHAPKAGKVFKKRIKQLADKAEKLIENLTKIQPESQEWAGAFISFGLNEVTPFTAYLRGLSVMLQQESPSSSPSTPNATAENVEAEPKIDLRQLRPANRKAYFAYKYAAARHGDDLEDQRAYDWLKEHGIDPEKGNFDALDGYRLPSFDTWSRQLRQARKSLGEQKYQPRAGRQTGHSVVKSSDI